MVSFYTKMQPHQMFHTTPKTGLGIDRGALWLSLQN